VGFVVDKAAQGQVLSLYFGFALPIIPPILHTHHHPSSWAGTIGQIVVDVPSELSLTPSQEEVNIINGKKMYSFILRIIQVLVVTGIRGSAKQFTL
jgi:hypothetical protein